MSWTERIFTIAGKGRLINILLFATYFVYIAIFIGVSHIDLYSITLLHTTVNLYIGLSLLYYFNPFYKTIEITSAMKRIIFMSGLVLLTNIMGVELLVLKKKLTTLTDTAGISIKFLDRV